MANELEREYVIPLRREWSKVPRYKRAKKAGKAVKEFLARHMKVYDKDLDKIKLDKYVNEEIWHRGIKKPPVKIKVKAIKDSKGIVHVELSEMPEKLKFKKAKEEKREKKAEEVKTKHVHAHEEKHKHEEIKGEKKSEEKSQKAEPLDTSSASSQSKEEAEEKKAATVESMEKMEKEMSKKMKHQTKQSKEPKRQFRKALQK